MPKRNHKSRITVRRPGSIMIMVVALLVLMALIGTAYIATARYDRGSASQNADNVQIDLIVESVLNLCKTSVAGDLFDGKGAYRSLTTDTTTPPLGPKDTWFYNHTTSTHYDLGTPSLRLDAWLSDRTPEFGSTPANSTNHYFWGRINLPLSTETEATGPVRSYFDDPTYFPQNNSQPLLLRHRSDTELEPTSKLVNGIPMPAFFINTGITGLPVPYRALAADADGDGIADSFLVRMPIGIINGVTYFYAVRIIDNAAAVNLNTAWGDDVPMSGSNSPNRDGWGRRLFPTSINLDEKFPATSPPPFFTQNEVKSLHAYRTQRAYPSGALTSWTIAQLNAPIPDGAIVPRTDFAFSDEHDAFWTQLARRPENPGRLPGSLLHYRAFPTGDLMSLVPRFVLAPASSGGTAETTLQADIPGNNSLGGPLMLGGFTRTKPYAPDDVDPTNLFSWGSQNFNYNNNVYSRRPLVVTSNSVSNAISPHYMPTGSLDLNGDGVTNDVPTSDMLDYSVSLNGTYKSLPPNPRYHLWTPLTAKFPNAQVPHDYFQFEINGIMLNYVYARSGPATASAPDSPTGPNYWEFIPNLPASPMKTSLNTAGFRELYRSYWNVMCGDPSNTTPYGPQSPPKDNAYIVPHMQKQFRPSLRDVHTPFGPGTYRFPPFQQLLLRAALAAVNTIDLRDSDDDVTSRTIVLKAFGRDGDLHPVEVTVYGSEPQPFITEVYANANTITDGKGDPTGSKNLKGYVAIELFNPYDHELDLTGWKLGLIDRRRARGVGNDTKLQIRDIYTFLATYPTPFGPNSRIPPGGHLVLENYNNGTIGVSSPNFAASYRPSQLTNSKLDTKRRIYIPELRQVFEDMPTETGGELVLLRPRRADVNKLATGTRPYDLYDESKIYDWIPVDSFDFTGLRFHATPAAGGSVVVHAWHYVRANGATGDDRWKCVYSGRYFADKGQSGTDPEDPRHEGTKDHPFSVPPDLTKTPPDVFDDTVPGPAVKLGEDDATSTFPLLTAQFPPIQLNNTDFAGPNELRQPSGANRNRFPFGGFQRVGDIMQVPCMGAYRVRELQIDPTTGAARDPLPNPTTGGYALVNNPDILLELNSLPMDSAFADDSIDGNNQFENIGRFCPLLDSITKFTPINISDPTDTNDPNYWIYWKSHSYDYAHRIFDYFTVIAPHEDYFPNINPDRTPDPLKNNTSPYRYWAGAATGYKQIRNTIPDAEPVKNIDNGTKLYTPEEHVGVHGLININTANWKVLSTVPWTKDPVENERIARSIVQQRDIGYSSPPIKPVPFNSLFDLLEVRDPANPSNYIFDRYKPAPTYDPDDVDGDFSPAGNGTDGVISPFEFEKAYLQVTRVSNLLTTRSDSFTAYVLVQGWRNANTKDAELVVQRRAAILIDRSGVSKANREPRSMFIPIE